MTATKLRPENEATVPQVGTVLYVNAPFDQAYEAIRDANGTLASSRDVARARIHPGARHSVSQYGSWVKEGFIYTAKQNPLFVLESPLVDAQRARDATSAHRSGKDFYLDDKTAKMYLDQLDEDAQKAPEARRVIRFGTNQNHNIPTNRFADDEVTRFLFKDAAAEYGSFLASQGITEMPVWLTDKDHVNKQKASFVRQLWLHGLDDDIRSGINGSYGDLFDDCRVRGVRPSNAAEGRVREVSADSGNSELAYNAGQINQYRTILQEVRKGDRAASDLEQVLEFIQGLPVKK